jgi:hypothetical protein
MTGDGRIEQWIIYANSVVEVWRSAAASKAVRRGAHGGAGFPLTVT